MPVRVEGVWHVMTDTPGERTEWCYVPGGRLWRTIVWTGRGWFQSDPSVAMCFQADRL